MTDSPRNYYGLASGLLRTCRELVADLTCVGNRFGVSRLPNEPCIGYRIYSGLGRFIHGKTTPIHGADTPRPSLEATASIPESTRQRKPFITHVEMSGLEGWVVCKFCKSCLILTQRHSATEEQRV